MTFYDQLLQLVRERRAEFRFESQADLAEVSVFLYGVMRGFELLNDEAFFKAKTLLATDFNLELTEYFRAHVEEERGHDVWLRRDIEEAGYTVPDVPDFLAAAIVGTQHYLLRHVHPVSFLGYMVYLEGDPMSMDVLEDLEERFGEPLLRCMRHHAEVDVQHSADLREICNLVPEELKPAVLHSLLVTAAYWNTAAVRQDVGSSSMAYSKVQ